MNFEIKLDMLYDVMLAANEAMGEFAQALVRSQRRTRRKAARVGTKGRRGARAVGKWGMPYRIAKLANTT